MVPCRRACLSLILFLAACAPVAPGYAPPPAPPEVRTVPPLEPQPPEAIAAEIAYIIRGSSPPNQGAGWRAVLFGRRLLLKSPTSAGWYEVRLGEPQAQDRRRIFSGDGLTLTFMLEQCALGEVFPALSDGILLEWDGGRFEGCGGRRGRATGVSGTTWELVQIGAELAPAGRSPAAILVMGEDGSLGGSLACNDGGLRRRWTAEGGFDGRDRGFEQTAVGCNDAAEAFGRRFWNGMMTATAWRRDGNRLYIVFADGSEAALRYLLAER
jgi:hypothetical protein